MVSLKENVTAIIMLYKNMKTMICSPDGNTDFFNIVVGVYQGDTLLPYMFIICLVYILQMSVYLVKENVFSLKKRREADDICRNYDRCRLHK